MASEQLMSDEDQKGLILGSLASGVLSAIIGARSGNIDPMAAGLAGAGTAYGGGHKQISDIRKAAQDQRDKQRSLAVSEAAQQESERYNKQRGDYYAGLSVDLGAQRKASAEKMVSEKAKLDEALAQGRIDRASHAEGIRALAARYREPAGQEDVSGLMTGGGRREPTNEELIQQIVEFPSTEKTVQGLLKPRYAAEAAGTKAEVQKELQASGGKIKEEAAVTKAGVTATAAEKEAARKEKAAEELKQTNKERDEAKAKAAEALKKIPSGKEEDPAKALMRKWLLEGDVGATPPAKGGKIAGVPVKGGPPADWMERARKVNPGMSDKEIKKNWKPQGE